MLPTGRPSWSRRLGACALVAVLSAGGCTVVPRERVEESQRLVRNLRAENAKLKDQLLSLEAQNRDLADRAVDDLRRLTARDEAIARLEQSVQSYQDDQAKLAAAYERLTSSLGRAGEPLDRTASTREADAPSQP